MRVVSNFGDGDSEGTEIRAREISMGVPTPLITTRLFVGGDFRERARVCISPESPKLELRQTTCSL